MQTPCRPSLGLIYEHVCARQLLSVNTTHLQVPSEARRGGQSPLELAVLAAWRCSIVGAGKRTWVLWKGNWPSLQPLSQALRIHSVLKTHHFLSPSNSPPSLHLTYACLSPTLLVHVLHTLVAGGLWTEMISSPLDFLVRLHVP